jgi:hypothetical protein
MSTSYQIVATQFTVELSLSLFGFGKGERWHSRSEGSTRCACYEELVSRSVPVEMVTAVDISELKYFHAKTRSRKVMNAVSQCYCSVNEPPHVIVGSTHSIYRSQFDALLE